MQHVSDVAIKVTSGATARNNSVDDLRLCLYKATREINLQPDQPSDLLVTLDYSLVMVAMAPITMLDSRMIVAAATNRVDDQATTGTVITEGTPLLRNLIVSNQPTNGILLLQRLIHLWCPCNMSVCPHIACRPCQLTILALARHQ